MGASVGCEERGLSLKGAIALQSWLVGDRPAIAMSYCMCLNPLGMTTRLQVSLEET